MMLGNLTIEQIEKRTGIEFPLELKENLIKNHNELADTNLLKKGEWHCFDIPFQIVFGDRESAMNFYKSLSEKSGQFKQQLQIGVAENGK